MKNQDIISMNKTEITTNTSSKDEKLELYYCFGVEDIKSFVILPTQNLSGFMRCLDCTLLFVLGAVKTNLPINIKDSLMPSVGDVCHAEKVGNILIKQIEWI